MNMKTAISVPPEVFKLSEKLSKKLKMSRSAIFALGVRKLGEELEEEELIARINAVCAEVDTAVEPQVKKYQAKRAKREEW